MTGTAMILAPPNPFLSNLRGSLSSVMAPEMDLTLRVGVMTAAGLTRAEILGQVKAKYPATEDIDIRMAVVRLRRIAEHWAKA